MQSLTQFAFLCTGQAPTGNELFDIQVFHWLWLGFGLSVAFFACSLIKKKVTNKKWRIGLFVALGLITVAGLALLRFIYAISTCGV